MPEDKESRRIKRMLAEVMGPSRRLTPVTWPGSGAGHAGGGTQSGHGKPRTGGTPPASKSASSGSSKAEFWKKVQEAKRIVAQAEEESDLRRDEFLQERHGPPDITFEPTPTINHSDPRTSRWQWWQEPQVLHMEWGDGGRSYNYYEVTKADVDRLVKTQSTGRTINSHLNNHPYGPA